MAYILCISDGLWGLWYGLPCYTWHNMDEIHLSDYFDAMNMKNELHAFQCSLNPTTLWWFQAYKNFRRNNHFIKACTVSHLFTNICITKIFSYKHLWLSTYPPPLGLAHECRLLAWNHLSKEKTRWRQEKCLIFHWYTAVKALLYIFMGYLIHFHWLYLYFRQ